MCKRWVSPTSILGVVHNSTTVTANSTKFIITADLWSNGIGYIVTSAYTVRYFVAGNKIESVYKQGDDVTIGFQSGSLIVTNNTSNQLTVSWVFVRI